MIWYNKIIATVMISLSLECLSSNIIEQALHIELQQTDKVESCSKSLQIQRASHHEVMDANYQKALEVIVQGVEQYPCDFSMQISFATVLGDYSELFTQSPELQSLMVTKSKNCFEKLMNEIDGQPISDIFYFKNEYYFRFAQYKNQFQNGSDRVAYYWNTPHSNSGIIGYYCQGVGAAHYAKELLKDGDKNLAQIWALQSLVAWSQYFSYKNDYYNAYVHYALALGILGYRDEMIKALQHSADMIKSDLHYHEFKEVIDFINSLETPII